MGAYCSKCQKWLKWIGKKDLEVLEKAKKSNILEKRLECTIDDSVYEEIKKIIEK